MESLFSIVETKQFKNEVERILHLPGCVVKNTIELTFVLDKAMPGEWAQAATKDILSILKRHSEVFRNIRLNVVTWGEKVTQDVIPTAQIVMGSYFDTWEEIEDKKRAGEEELYSFLRLFQARSKIVIVFSKDGLQQQNEAACKKLLQPFLGRKLINLPLCQKFL